MFTVYESKLNRDVGEPIVTRMVQREDETNFWAEGDGTEQGSYSKTSTFRNQADAEKQNAILVSKGRKAALEFAKTIQQRETKQRDAKSTAKAIA
ncbi:MAG TPA: hypothetical protein VGH32_14470 [Pirellulales bacterium]|jgi:hypothetical protein